MKLKTRWQTFYHSNKQIHTTSLNDKTLIVHQQQLSGFLIYFGYIHWFFMSLLAITGYISHDILFIIGAFILAAQNCIVRYSKYLVENSQLQKAVTQLCISLLFTSVLAVLLYPWVYVVVIMVPIVVITIALPYLDNQLKILTISCVICLISVVIIGEFPPRIISFPPDIIIRTIRSTTGIGAALLLLILLSQFKTRLTTTIKSQMESQMAAYQAQAANAQKSHFLAQMSHELRTPLNGINPMLEALLLDIYGELNTDQRDCIQRAYDCAEHLLVVINDVLDLAKVEAGRIDLHFSAQNIHDLCYEPVSILHSQAEKKGISLTVDIDPLLPSVWCDHRTIKQVLLNLVGNAIKFTESEGRVTISARQSMGGSINIAVSDTGIGIAIENQEKIWEAFTQVEDVLDRQQNGTGLGLTITKQLVEVNGGTIHLESKLGSGSTFLFDIPSASSIQKKLQRFSSFDSSITVALIDDELTSHDIVGSILNHHGYRMMSLLDSKTSIPFIEDNTFDIIILDIFMPGLNGWEVLSSIRHHSNPKINNTPVIICSIDDDMRRRSLFTNTGYLAKPIKEHKLIEAINNILGENHA